MKTNIVNFYLVLLVAANVAARSFCQSTSSLPSLWTLEACVDYARNNNLAVRQAEVSRQEAEVSVVQSEAAYWPTLSFSAGANYTNQPYGSPVNAFSTNAGLNFNWRIYDGSRRLTVEQNRIAGREAALKVEQTANTVEEQVMLLYVQA
ncbi:MAG: TolC family protein, partial [Paludibacteraceae bacterium]|nr:TolC family protein [Paludibacteraceae bacterium]